MDSKPATELNRKVSPHNFSVTLAGDLTALIPSGRNRRALIIGNGTANVIFVNFNEKPTAGIGIPVKATDGRLELNGVWYGDAMIAPIWVIGSIAGDVIQCVEFVESP
jgi:hypothetical protein